MRRRISSVYMAGLIENSYWRDFVAGEAHAFRKLYNYYADRLFTFGCRYCGDVDLVKDLIHDLFVDLHRYRLRLNPEVHVTAYLYRSLRRKITAAGKKQQQYTGLHPLLNDEQPFLIEWDTEQTTIRNEEEAELMRRVADEVNKLPTRQQEALYLRFTCELDYDEVADIMEVSVASCRTAVYRAIKTLREKLEETRISTQLFTILLLTSPILHR